MITKGKWEAPGGIYILDEQGREIAHTTVRTHRQSFEKGQVEAFANAQLIAAAPDLYEALKELVEARWMYTVDWTSPEEHEKIIKQAFKALAKVEVKR